MTTDFEQWQQDFQQVMRKMEDIERFMASPAERTRRHLCIEINQLIQAEKHLDRLFTGYQRYHESTRSTNDTARAMVHWLYQIAERGRAFFDGSSQFLSQCTWLHQAYERISGQSLSSEYLPDKRQAFELRKAFENLQKTKQVLTRQCDQLTQTKNMLRAQYQLVLCADANRDAAGSLQAEWGLSFANARLHPVMRELRSLFQHIRVQTHDNSKTTTVFRKLNQTFQQESRELMYETKRLIEQNGRQSSPKVRPKVLKTLETRLKGTTDLEKKLDQLSHNLIKNPPSSVPFRVKKQGFQNPKTKPAQPSRNQHGEHIS
jgi:hypothetical protein